MVLGCLPSWYINANSVISLYLMHKTMRSILFPLFIVCSTFLVGCGSSVPVIRPFKMDIQQGNVVTSKMLLQLRPGMTKSQVRFIMGTPLIVDSFHTNRWDYFYQLRQAGKVVEQRRVILDFEKDLLARVRGDVVPQGTPGADAGSVTLAKEPLPAAVKPVEKEGVFENLKFWKDRDSTKDGVPNNNESKPATKQITPQAKPAEPVPASAPAPQESISSEPASDATSTESASPESSPAVETPSLLVVPIVIPPSDSTPTEIKPVEQPAQQPAAKPASADSPASESKPVTETSPIIEPKKATPSTPDSDLPAKKEDEFIFRLERNLDTKDVELKSPQQVNKQTSKPTEKSSEKTSEKTKNIDEKPLPAEEEPGYFEKMLEKIGF